MARRDGRSPPARSRRRQTTRTSGTTRLCPRGHADRRVLRPGTASAWVDGAAAHGPIRSGVGGALFLQASWTDDVSRETADVLGYPCHQARGESRRLCARKSVATFRRNTARAGCKSADSPLLWERTIARQVPLGDASVFGPRQGRPIRRLRRPDPGAYGVNVRAALRGSARKSPKRRTGDTARGRRVRPTLSPVSARGPGLPHGRDRRDIDPFCA
jgi:hypothetical protein